jgi:phosphoglycolate phosphatase-like HAD superfamily hydrolase
MTKIIFDCDDICLKFPHGFSNFLAKYYGIITRSGDPCNWNMMRWSGLPQDRVLELLNEFSTSEYFGKLEPVDGAVEGIKTLVEAGYDPVIVTACVDHPLTMQRRIQNVTNVFGEGTFSKIDFTPMGTSKLEQLSQYEPTIFVEDNYKNALTGLEAGHDVLIRRVPHNLEHRKNAPAELTWFDDFSEVVNHILERQPIRSLESALR